MAATPVPVVLLCEELGWSHADLLATPRVVVRDFLAIAAIKAERKA